MFESEILTATLVLVNVALGRCVIISTPNNTAVVVGQRMEMECRTTSGTIVREWKRERHLGKGIDNLFLNWDTAPRDTNSQFPQFGVDVDGSGSGFLYSNSTEIEDAGIYSCVVQDRPNAKPVQYSAHLIVLESTPVCEANLTAGDNASIGIIWIQCSVNFRGGWWPLVEWKHRDGNQVRKILSDGVRTVTVNNSTTISTLTTVVDSIKGVLSVSFKIYFSRASDRTSVNATNTPSYEHTWIESFGAELSDRLPSTGLNTTCTWSEADKINTPTIPSFAGSSSVPENGKYSLLLLLVVTMATIIVIMAITTIVCFLRFRSNKAKSRLEVTSCSESHRNIESLQRGDHSPLAITDHYDTIEELNIFDDSTAESPITLQRTGLLPTPGYSGLQSAAQILPPSVYCRMNANATIEKEMESGKKSVLTNVPFREETEACLVKGVLQSEYNESIPNKVGVDIYLAPIDDIKDIHSAVADPSYIELTE